MMRSFLWSMQLDRWQAMGVVALALLVASVADLVTGPTVSMSIAYLFADCLAAWTLRERAGICVVTLTVAISSLINGFGVPPMIEHHELTPMVALWNTTTRALSAIMIVLMVATLRHSIDRERWRASTDHLTRSLNGSAFRARIEQVARGRRRRNPMLLIYMDLDGFKAVNDRHGHAAGDLVLRRFADEARARLRTGDLFARLGGDEFCALVAIDSDAEPEQVADSLHVRLREALQATGYPVTCSMGAVVLDAAAAMDTDRALRLADQALLHVKHNGKNAVRFACDVGEALQHAA
ncbi:GGDEF domain-containing protein [Sphingomonas azotifigens]|uniref:GGDEF domain-containing protein n=1 Tax=Sphingomonas azotifigens TaxID=330920 RepID=UPI001FE77F22|nr:GGDEF domain-containing protein [Sphingomonas azotifigens]